jgi:1-acyl-sn-glycerol-3-phosphate acyltransferase
MLRWLLSGKWFYIFGRTLALIVLKLFYRLRVEGMERVPRSGGLVVASNHISTLDPPVVGVSVPREIHFMAKKELFEGRWLGPIIRGLRAFPVDRRGGDIGAIKGALRRLTGGLAVGIFAQGTRNAGDADALDGAAFLAQRAGVPILPAAVWREGRHYRVRFGEPLLPEGRSKEEMAALTDQLMERVRDLLPERALPTPEREAEGASVAEKA